MRNREGKWSLQSSEGHTEGRGEGSGNICNSAGSYPQVRERQVGARESTTIVVRARREKHVVSVG